MAEAHLFSKAHILALVLSACAGKNELQMHSPWASGCCAALLQQNALKTDNLNASLRHLRGHTGLGK